MFLDEIIDCINEHGPLTKEELKKHFPDSDTNLSFLLRSAEIQGLVFRKEDGNKVIYQT